MAARSEGKKEGSLEVEEAKGMHLLFSARSTSWKAVVPVEAGRVQPFEVVLGDRALVVLSLWYPNDE